MKKYEIIDKHGMGMPYCVSNAIMGVGRSLRDRKILKDIYQTTKIDFVVCPYCYYIVTGPNSDILFKDLSLLKKLNNMIFIEFPDGNLVNVNRQNFSIVCSLEECKPPDELVREYVPKPKKKPKPKEDQEIHFTLIERKVKNDDPEKEL